MNQKNDLFSLEKAFYIVTGGLGLLGKKHCEAIAYKGGIPVVLDLNIDESIKFSEQIENSYGVKPIIIQTDITNEDSLKEALAFLLQRDYSVKGLINNAARNPGVSKEGLMCKGRLESFSINEWNSDIAVGLTGSFLCSKIFGTHMAQNKGGVILNISSDLGLIAPNQNLYSNQNLKESEQPVKPITYSVVKSGIVGLTRYLATYWPEKIRCNCLCPGGIFNNQDEKFLNKINQLIPIGRMANVDEYKGAIVFMLSNASSYMNGTILPIDGGRTVW